MSTVDALILIALCIAGLRGWLAGFMRSTVGMMAVAAGVLVAARGWPLLQPYMGRIIPQEGIAKWTSVVSLAAVTTILADWLLQRLRGVFEQGLLGAVNHVAGAGFNIIFVGFLLGFALLIANDYGGEALRSFVEKSNLAPVLVSLARYLLGLAKPILPGDGNLSSITVA